MPGSCRFSDMPLSVQMLFRRLFMKRTGEYHKRKEEEHVCGTEGAEMGLLQPAYCRP